MKLRSTPQSEDALMIMSLIVSSPQIENSYPNSYPPLHMARTWMDMHSLRRLHDSQYIMKNPFTNENSNLSNIFHNNIHRKKVESLKVRSTEEFLCQFAWLPCRFFRGRRQGRQPLNKYALFCDRYIGTSDHQPWTLPSKIIPILSARMDPNLLIPMLSWLMDHREWNGTSWRIWAAKSPTTLAGPANL